MDALQSQANKNMIQAHRILYQRNKFLLFSGLSNQKLAHEICDLLSIKLGNMIIKRFSDGEVNIKIFDNIRGKDIYIVQSTSPPVNENFIELLLLISSMKRGSAKKINAIIPYYGYSKQNKKTSPRVPIPASDVARYLEGVGVDRVISIDLHCGQIQGFFPPQIPVDNLNINQIAINYLVKNYNQKLDNLVIVAPKPESVARAKLFKDQLNQIAKVHAGLNVFKNLQIGLALINFNKESEQSELFLGSVKQQNVLIVDDMIETGENIVKAAKALKFLGAKKVYAFATHGLFTYNAYYNIKFSDLDKVIVTNTIQEKEGEKDVSQIARLTVAPVLAEAIKRIQLKESISFLFESEQQSE